MFELSGFAALLYQVQALFKAVVAAAHHLVVLEEKNGSFAHLVHLGFQVFQALNVIFSADAGQAAETTFEITVTT